MERRIDPLEPSVQMNDAQHVHRESEKPVALFGQPVSLGHVAHDLGKTDQLSRSIAHRRNNATGPETRAVTAHVPALVFSAPQRRRGVHLFLRNISGPVFRSEKLACVFADDLFLGVTEYVLRSDIPVRDDSVCICHEDGIVANVFDCFAVDVFGSPVDCAPLGAGRHELAPLSAATITAKNHEKDMWFCGFCSSCETQALAVLYIARDI